MYQFREQLIKLVKTCTQIIIIYSRLAWVYLVRFKILMLPKLKQFTVACQLASIKFGRLIVKYSKIFFQYCQQASRKLAVLTTRIAQKLSELLHQLWHLTLIYTVALGRATRKATIIFIQLCVVAGTAFKRAAISVYRQIFLLLKRLGQIIRTCAIAIWRTTISAILTFSQLCVVAGTAFKRAAISVYRQIFLLFNQLGQFTQKSLITLLRTGVSAIQTSTQLCLSAGTAFKHACISVNRQLNLLLKQFCYLVFKLAYKSWIYLSAVIKWIYNCSIKLLHICLACIKYVINLFITITKEVSSLIKSVAHYLWKKWSVIRERLYQYSKLVRLDKPIGIFLLLWPTLWALWIASEGKPDFTVLLIFISGVILMRSAGCAINDFIDRDIDTQVKRTRERPIVNGSVSPREAIDVALLLITTAFFLVTLLNHLTLILSVVAVILAIIYPFMKRITYLPQFFLGLAFAWSVPMAFAAQTNSVPVIAWLLLLTTILWAVAYDTMYAMVDREDDIEIGVRSTAILFDDADRFIIGCIQLLVLVALVIIGQRIEMGPFYYAGLAIAAMFSLYQQFLIKDRIPENCFKAFLNNNWFGATIFAGIYCHYLFK